MNTLIIDNIFGEKYLITEPNQSNNQYSSKWPQVRELVTGTAYPKKGLF